MITRIPSDVLEGVVELLALGSQSSIQKFSFIGGGCINSGGKLSTSKGDFFLKWNDVNIFPHMFEAESRGLALLSRQNAIRIPQVLGYGEKEVHQFLVLEYIKQEQRSSMYWEQLGIRLSHLHNATDTAFGLDHDNYIGSLRQHNTPHSSWVDFFIEQRLTVQLKLSLDSGTGRPGWSKQSDSLFKKLPSLLPEDKPSLLHGDLWSGNLIIDEKGEPCLIDPAVYFGNREADLAMTKLFGGFSDEFYEVYEEHSKLQQGYQQRLELYNLYPLLAHVNLFGGAYVGSVDAILNRFA
jgi:protein-ribulosamine 3-kinase